MRPFKELLQLNSYEVTGYRKLLIVQVCEKVLKTLTCAIVTCVERLWAFSSCRKKDVLSGDTTAA